LYFRRFLATFLLKFCLNVNIERSEQKMRKYSILGIKIIGLWPHDPLVICHANINSNCIHKYKEKMCLGRRNVRHFCITTTSQIIGAAAAAPAAPLSTPLFYSKTCTMNMNKCLILFEKSNMNIFISKEENNIEAWNIPNVFGAHT